MRKTYTWKLPRTSLKLGQRTAVMGILNLTPDSFSDGGEYNDPARALERALVIEAEGADILDIGGESTRPDSDAVSTEEEIGRVIPILESIAPEIAIPISIDTYHSEVARRAVDAGAQIINDISGFRLDPEMAVVARETRCGVVLMHSRGTRDEIHLRPDDDSPEVVRDELTGTIDAALEAGIGPSAVVADPGIGFSKTRSMSLEILKRLRLFSTLDYPLLVGASRKSFIRTAISAPEAPTWATAAAVTFAIVGGAHIVRVHDVAAMRVVAEIADAVERAGEPALDTG